jgi:hypothetical protein
MAKRIVILSGAGAVFPWGGPTTTELTNIIRQDTRFRTLNNVTLGDYLYTLLQAFYVRDPESVNFETIINFIEEFYDFFNSKAQSGYHEFNSNASIGKEINLTIYNNIFQLGSWCIPNANAMYYYNNQRMAAIGNGIEMDYLKNVFEHFINLIINRINEYDSRCLNAVNNQINNLFYDFYTYLKRTRNIVNYYTLNYDNCPQKILNNHGRNLFDGFDVANNRGLKYNFLRVNHVNITPTYYNLHGSIHFGNDIFDWICDANNYFILPIGNDFHNQAGKALIKTNIVTGLSKDSRTLTDPFNDFLSSFQYDCAIADIIILIGYSFSDIHINQALNRRIHLNNPKIYNIGYVQSWQGRAPVSQYNDDWVEISSRISNALGVNFNIGFLRSDWYTDINDTMKFYWRGFGKFLIRRNWGMIR